MRPWTIGAVLTASTLLGLLPGAPLSRLAHAQGFPSFAAGAEALVVGKGRTPGTARTQGTWTWDARGLALVEPSRIGDSFWFPTKPEARLTDGAVRARLVFGSRADASLMFRATVPEAVERVSGYGLSVEGNSLRFYRWDEGIATPQGAAISVPELRRRVGVEIVIFMVGPLITATVYDLDNLEQIATLALTERRYTTGEVGLRAFRKQDPGTRLTHLSLLRAGQARAPDPSQLVGGKRVARIREADLERLAPSLRSLVVEREPEVTLLLHLDELARLRRDGVVPTLVHADVPWLYVDPEYAARRDQPPEPTPEGFRLDLGYKDANMVADLLAAYSERFPRLTRRAQIGTSVEGRPIWALKISDRAGRDEREPVILLDGGHHALELLSTEMVLDAIQTLLSGYGADPEMTRLVDGFEIWCVPLVNPDGNQAFMTRTMKAGRKNSRDINGDGQVEPREGVDLNRNYPFAWGTLGEIGSRSWPEHHRYRGPAPGSEPEVVAMMELARRIRPVAAISYHTNGTIILSPYATGGVKNPLNDEAWPIAKEIAAATPRQPNRKYYRVRKRLYAVDGVSKDWLRHELGTLAYLIELPYHNPREPGRRALAIAASRPTWMTLMRRYLDGPSLSGRVTDPDGAPLAAEVRIAEIVPRQGERWTARAQDGWFARYLPAPGAYTVRVEAPGFEPARRRVEVGGHLSGLRFRLRPSEPSPASAE